MGAEEEQQRENGEGGVGERPKPISEAQFLAWKRQKLTGVCITFMLKLITSKTLKAESEHPKVTSGMGWTLLFLVKISVQLYNHFCKCRSCLAILQPEMWSLAWSILISVQMQFH
ncbi:uncharacterized protein LOC103717223 isoform X1 [Phoenix dactylifera]|uniref:Uncharacterized protein LOC103717223 isoform X1 n=1 Tax=Phoenix dactylifera TaxID=42345 RepID=A0A8B8JAC9_PHODC|nr:uncharacterized protein LOC103717223 isoform X1 [Phoenix dactylifera]